MINVDELHRFILFIANKQQSGTNPTPARLNLAIKRAQVAWVNKKYHKKDPRTGQVSGYQQNQNNTDDLSFLMVKGNFDISQDGVLQYPSDYMHSSSLRYKYKKRLPNCKDVVTKETDVTEIMDSEKGNILSSSIVPPTKRYPYACYYNDHIQLYPRDLGKVIFTYLRNPEDPIWAYEVVNGRPVYDSVNSVDLEAPGYAMNEIAFEALSYLGIHIREAEVAQYSEIQQQKDNA